MSESWLCAPTWWTPSSLTADIFSETEEIRGCWMLDVAGLRQLDTDFEYQTQDVSWCLRGCRSFNLVPEMCRLVEVLLALSVGRFESELVLTTNR